MKIMEMKEFVQKNREDKEFKKMMSRKLTRIFCDFKIFRRSKLIRRLIKQNRVVFPIDVRKVPLCLQDSMEQYHEYLSYLLKSTFAIIKNGETQ